MNSSLVTSWRTGPWPPARPAPFRVPGCAHVQLSPLPQIPETACGADDFDLDASIQRCHGEAVERLTAWRPDALPTPDPATPRLDPGLFAQDGIQPVPCGRDTQVEELLDTTTPAGRFGIDSAAVCLGTTGWFPAGSTGYAAAPTFLQAVASAAWEVLQRDLLTRWWRGTQGAESHQIHHHADALLKAAGIQLRLLEISGCCCVVAAFDEVRRLAAVGSSAGPDPDRRAQKAAQEALITLAQLTALLPAATGNRATLDRPAAEETELEDTLTALLDPRFAAQIRSRFDQPPARSAATSAAADPVVLLRERGYRVFAATIGSPESEWADLTVVRVLAAGAFTPLPRACRPDELPVPLA